MSFNFNTFFPILKNVTPVIEALFESKKTEKQLSVEDILSIGKKFN